MYNVTLYINTGFTLVNVPATPAVLKGAAETTLTLPALDIYQEYQLNSVSVRVTPENRDQAILADYIQIGDAYYAITGYEFTSFDVLNFGLYFEALLSARAKGSIKSLDGMTVRRRVTEAEDTFGAFTEEDYLIAPNKPVKLVVGSPLFSTGTSLEWTLIYSSIDLADLQSRYNNSTGELIGKTFKDPTNPDNGVTVPYVEPVKTGTTFSVGDKTLPVIGNMLYKSNAVSSGVGLARSLGVESAIISQYRLPLEFVESIDGGNINTDGHVDSIEGIDKSVSCGLSLKYATVRNKRLLYGNYNQFGLITAAGNKIEFLPEQIASSFDDDVQVRCIADVRPDGAVYFRFKDYLGDSSTAMFFNNAAKGLSWDEAPLRYTKPSGNGNALNSFAASRYVDAGSFYGRQALDRLSYTGKNFVNGTKGLVNAVGGISYSDVSSDGPLNVSKGPELSINGGQVAGGLGQVANAFTSQVYSNLGQTLDSWKYEQEKQNELREFGISQTCVVPEIQFPVNSSIIGDVLGHGCIPYRYELDESDLTRLDILLTMYGYKDTEPFRASMLSEHKDFEYLQLSGVSIQADNIPMWWRNQIANELNTGIRIWHVKPDVGYFDGSKTVG